MINNYYCFCKNKIMICLNTFLFIKFLKFILLVKYTLYIEVNYMKVLTIPEEKYSAAFLKLKIISEKCIVYFTGVIPHQMSSLHKDTNYSYITRCLMKNKFL
jgi:hypothetical protein